MNDIGQAFLTAFKLIAGWDRDLAEIIGLSLQVSLIALAVAAAIGLPLGAAVALLRFPGRRALAVLLSALMGLPPVVVGLIVYLMLSRAGPLGVLGLLFTPTAMIIAQCLLITPIIAALTRQIVLDLWSDYREQLTSLGCGPARAIPTLLWDARTALVTVILAGFGRATAEVGAVMIVGGNIDHVTRVMTTAIALETSRGDLTLALALGVVLMALSLTINGAAFLCRDWADRGQGRLAS
ncbi:MAG: ABC transporter permease [Pseudomonadota bacterium]